MWYTYYNDNLSSLDIHGYFSTYRQGNCSYNFKTPVSYSVGVGCTKDFLIDRKFCITLMKNVNVWNIYTPSLCEVEFSLTTYSIFKVLNSFELAYFNLCWNLQLCYTQYYGHLSCLGIHWNEALIDLLTENFLCKRKEPYGMKFSKYRIICIFT